MAGHNGLAAAALCRGFFLGPALLLLLGFSDLAHALTISNIMITPLDHGATVAWDTDAPAQGTLTFIGPNFEESRDGPWNVTHHEVTVYRDWDVLPQQSYQIRLSARAISGGQTASAGPFTFTTLADVTPPVINAVRVVGTASHSAILTWESSATRGMGSIDYGPSLNYGQVATTQAEFCGFSYSPQEMCTGRLTAVLTNLAASAVYDFQVRTDDGYGNNAQPIGNFSITTDTLWTQDAFQPQPVYYGQTCATVGDAPDCLSGTRYFWPKEMSWTGNELLVHFNATAEDLTRSTLAFELRVTAVQNVGTRWVQLEVKGGSNSTTPVTLHAGLVLDHAGVYTIPVEPSIFAPGLNYLRLRATTISNSELGFGQSPPYAVWDRMALRFAQLTPATLTDEQLLDRTEAQAARYFWEQAFSTNGFVRDYTNSAQASVGATGFGLAALVVMAKRHGTSTEWTVSPSQARVRAQQILDAAVAMQQQQTSDPGRYGKAGFLFHFVDPDGRRYRNLPPGVAESESNVEVSTVDTALFLAGALAAGQYFGGSVQTRANQFLSSLNWNYYFDANATSPFYRMFHHGWQPQCIQKFTIPAPDGQGCLADQRWNRPTDETMLINLLALAGNTANADFRRSFYQWPRVARSYAGYSVVNSFFGSLFTYLFGQCFFDFDAMNADSPAAAGAAVAAVDWFQNAKNAALANRQFVIDQSSSVPTYTPEQWGLSACYRPDGSYFGDNGAKPTECSFNTVTGLCDSVPAPQSGQPHHDGTVPPYGAISTMPLVRTSPTEALNANLAFQAVRHYYTNHFSGLWGPYGPRDSLKTQTVGGQPVTAYSPLYVGIDVGPELLMMENYRTGLISRAVMSHPNVRAAVALHFPSVENRAPTLQLIDSQTVTEGQPVTISVAGVDPNGDALTFTATGLPAGASFSSQTFNWTPNFDQGGASYPVTFRATDPGGLFDEQQATITVQDAGAAATVAITTPALGSTVDRTQPVSIGGTATAVVGYFITSVQVTIQDVSVTPVQTLSIRSIFSIPSANTVSWGTTLAANTAAGHKLRIQAQAFATSGTSSPVVIYINPDGSVAVCYVLTAAYGRADALAIGTLNTFREQLLWPLTPWHQRLLAWYDRVGPPMAQMIRRQPILQSLIRGIFTPLAKLARWVLTARGFPIQP